MHTRLLEQQQPTAATQALRLQDCRVLAAAAAAAAAASVQQQ
jgi:hypothetical protein